MTSDKQDILVYAHCLPSVVKKKKKKNRHKTFFDNPNAQLEQSTEVIKESSLVPSSTRALMKYLSHVLLNILGSYGRLSCKYSEHFFRMALRLKHGKS